MCVCVCVCVLEFGHMLHLSPGDVFSRKKVNSYKITNKLSTDTTAVKPLLRKLLDDMAGY